MTLALARDRIDAALQATVDRHLPSAAVSLLAALGYKSDRVPEPLTGEVDEFMESHPAQNSGTVSERYMRETVRSVHVLFQVTDHEIGEATQGMLFETGGFDKGRETSFLFVVAELEQDRYPRGRYAMLTREINKRFSMPTVVLFRTSSGLLTLSFIGRRAHKREAERAVLGSVSLIREIVPSDPHRAHLDILHELSLDERLKWMKANGKSTDFDGLLAAWLDALDTEALNRRFYRDLFAWFERAVEEARIPRRRAKSQTPQEHIIRLITRMLFVWFVKEKGLIAEELFIENQAGQLLKDYDRDTGNSYYRAVLQNLFFATLNTEISERRFSTKSQKHHRNPSVFRYKAEMADPSALVELFAKTPFINGGLFDCLDTFEATGRGGYRVDYFTDNPAQRRGYSIPNRLFFDDKGLIPLFNRYKFTVEENTPTEQEVALDPELLGKVFENLLAAFNPETRETARKQTGSYYTPRPVVDYMVDETLVAHLNEKFQPDDEDKDFWRDRLRYLLNYAAAFDDAEDLFSERESDGIVSTISEIKVLDPAVGSGAFPMAVLHKLTMALRRLDASNERWEALQKKLALERADEALDTPDRQQRYAELQEISDTFEKYRDSDFGRKLYLIQNSIFGVDIQPVACQIAKLRFFISLAIEQEPTDDQGENYGIRPLPNLETRFVAANTLLGLGGEFQVPLGGRNRVTELNEQLRENRERYFHAGVRSEKMRIREKDAALRSELKNELRRAGMSASDAGKVARWDPYEQNAKVDWFDSVWMFDIADGFDVVIGNPPYVQLQKNGGELRRKYEGAGYETFAGTGDVYQLFCERGCRLLKRGSGLLCYITSNSWLKAEYGKKQRHYLSERHTPLQLIEMGKDVFENVIVDATILLLREGRNGDGSYPAVDMDKLVVKDFPPDESLWGSVRPGGDAPWSVLSHTERSVMDKMRAAGTVLSEWDLRINYGIKTGYNDAFIIDGDTRRALMAEDPNSEEIIKPILRGRDIQRYLAKWAGLWLLFVPWHFPLHGDSSIEGSSDEAEEAFKEQYPSVYNYLLAHRLRLASRNSAETGIRYEWYALQRWAANYHHEFAKEKLFWMDMSPKGRFAISDSEEYCNDKGFIMTGGPSKYLCALLNSSIVTWGMRCMALTTGLGLIQWKKFAVERLPIPKISSAKQRPLIRLVDRILDAKTADPNADTSELEEEIDRLVYELYGLTKAEVAAIERDGQSIRS